MGAIPVWGISIGQGRGGVESLPPRGGWFYKAAMMPRLALLGLLAVIVAAPPALAAKGDKDDPDRPIGKTRPEDRSKPEPWPRLDPGAVLCESQAELDQHFAVMNAKLDGAGAIPPEPNGCQTVRFPISVTVLERAGPGHTQVKLSRAPGTVGWTDMFLPEKQAVPQRPSNERAPGL